MLNRFIDWLQVEPNARDPLANNRVDPPAAREVVAEVRLSGHTLDELRAESARITASGASRAVLVLDGADPALAAQAGGILCNGIEWRLTLDGVDRGPLLGR